MAPILSARARCACGDGPTPPGDCPDGEECLPSDYIDPDDCPPVDCPACALLEAPDQIEGLLAWYDGDDGATFTLDGANRVDLWADKSGNGFDLENTSDSGGSIPGPLHDGALTLNGRSVVYFDTYGRRLTSVSGIDQTQPFTVFAVGANLNPELEDFGSSYTWYAFGSFGSPALQNRPENGDLFFQAGTSPDYPSNRVTAEAGKPYIVTAIFDDANGSIGRVNGVEAFSGLDLGGNDASSALAVGSDEGGHTMGEGDAYIAELIAFDRVLTADEIACVEDYLLRKWLSDLPACSCAGTYVPYCLGPENADDPDTVILATSPFAYYPLVVDAADVSGGGHDATGGIGTNTFVGPITSKATGALQCTNGGSVTFPPPVGDMGAIAASWSAVMVLQVDAYDSGAGGASALDLGFPFFSWCGGSPPKVAHVMGGTGHLIPWSDSNFGRLGNYVRSRDVLFAIGEPHVLVFNAIDSVNSIGTLEVWVDGVLVMTSSRTGDGTDGSIFCVGRIPGGGPYFGGMDFTYSNLATWDRALTEAEIASITAALVDDAILATSWVPS